MIYTRLNISIPCLLLGDFNTHLDKLSSADLLSLIRSSNLSQTIGPTLIAGKEDHWAASFYPLLNLGFLHSAYF